MKHDASSPAEKAASSPFNEHKEELTDQQYLAGTVTAGNLAWLAGRGGLDPDVDPENYVELLKEKSAEQAQEHAELFKKYFDVALDPQSPVYPLVVEGIRRARAIGKEQEQ